MSYTRPDGDATDFSFTGVAYTRPDGDATDFAFLPDSYVGVGNVTIEITAEGYGEAAPSIVAVGDVAIEMSASGVAAHGVSGVGEVTIGMAAAGVGTHHRYEVRGEVRDQGVLVERRVRVYLRSSGALVGQGDTTAGAFAIPTGFAADEHYIIPIHLDSEAVDWSPPCANRVVAVLMED